MSTLQERKGRLAGYEGMNEERAAELLKVLPELGCVPTEAILLLAGLKKELTADHRPIAKPNSHLALRVLLAALPEAARAQSRLGELLRHLIAARSADTTVRCLIALLRSYNDHLIHTAPAATTYEADNDGFGCLDAAEDGE